MIELVNIAKSYPERVIFSDISFTFPDRGLFLLTGDNQCGKTTLLDIIGLLDYSYTGSLCFNGWNASNASTRQKEKFREKNIHFIFSGNNLLECLSTDQNYHLTVNKKTDLPALSITNQDAKTLSGGEELLVSLKREEHLFSSILLLDEVSSALDSSHLSLIEEEIRILSQNRIVLFATHDKRAFSLGKRLYLGNVSLHD